MKIYLAADHAGFELKEVIKDFLRKNQHDYSDLGTHSNESVNWAEYGAKAAQKVSEDPETSRAVLICGSGIGMSMIANKFKKVRAALCHTTYTAEMSRKHNNANILTLGARILDQDEALKIVQTWLETSFEGGRHKTRIDYLHNHIEKQNFK
ncbi:MAG: ribose 5-phosphate isomerase B [Candidatus Aminicenantes bacterium]|nr:ribose 5-phosphate isomerase B [Candidatus Aminicenantes bacterium]